MCVARQMGNTVGPYCYFGTTIVITYKNAWIMHRNFDESYNLYGHRLYFIAISGTIVVTFVRPGKTRAAESGEHDEICDHSFRRYGG